MKCLYNDLRGYSVIVFVGAPGAGKTTLALNLVAYALQQEGKCTDWDECRRAAARRLFLGSSVEELAEFLLSIVESKTHDYVILDDAALGFWDVSHPVAWARLMDVIKIARNAIATKMLIFTTTSRQFLSKRVVSMARVYYVYRTRALVEDAGACYRPAFDDTGQMIDVQVVKHVSAMLVSAFSTKYTRAEVGLYARVVDIIPVSQKYAMPGDVETFHIFTRKERAVKALRDVITIMHKKREEGESL